MTGKGIKYVGYSPWIRQGIGEQQLIQIFISDETGEVIAVHMAWRKNRWDTWSVPVVFEKAD